MWKCPICKREKETKDNIKITICPNCIETMEEVE